MKLTKKNIYISLFGVLYGGVALVSLIHAVSFFALANLLWLAILLAIIFEIGQSAVLFSILTSSTGKSKTMPWILMCILTAVQILGNVFSSYKYIVTNSPENLRFFKEPVFIWTTIPDAQATVIITYIVGGILPLVALAMSAMVTNYLENENNQKNIELNEGEESLISQNSILQIENQGLEEPKIEEPKIEGTDSDGGVVGEQGEDGLKVLTESLNSKDNEIEKLKQELEELKHPKIVPIPVNEIIHSQPMEEPEGLKQLKKEENEDIENEKNSSSDNGSKDQEIQANENPEQSTSKESQNDDKDNGQHKQISNLNKEIKQLKEDHDKIVDEKFEILGKYNNLYNKFDEQNIQIKELQRKLKEKDKELLEKENIQNQSFKEENLKQVEDLIKNGIQENKPEKVSHFINQ